MTTDEINAAGRHALTAIGSIVATLGVLGILKPGDVATITSSLNDIGGALATIATAIGPLMALASAYYASRSASPAKQVEKAAAIPGTTVITTPALAAAIPATNVISNAEHKATVI